MSVDEKRRFNRPMVLISLVVIVALGAVATRSMRLQRKKVDLVQSISTLRFIGLALYEFEAAYGSFPDDRTAPLVAKRTGSALLLQGFSANHYLRQLVAADFVGSESSFYCKTAFTRKPAGGPPNKTDAFGPGTVGFGYLMNGTSAQSSKGDPGRPVLCAPLAYDGTSVSDRFFDPRIFDHRVAVLRTDNSVLQLWIDPDSHEALLSDGTPLLKSGLGTVWGDGTTPVIVPPLPKR